MLKVSNMIWVIFSLLALGLRRLVVLVVQRELHVAHAFRVGGLGTDVRNFDVISVQLALEELEDLLVAVLVFAERPSVFRLRKNLPNKDWFVVRDFAFLRSLIVGLIREEVGAEVVVISLALDLAELDLKFRVCN